MIDENVLNKFIKIFPIPQGNKIKPYIILLDAYTGMGKSTVALEIQKFDNSVILNSDEVRHFLNDYNDKTNLKNELQKYRLEKLLVNGNSCICDSCFCHDYESKIKYYKSLGYKYYIIRLECSDEVVKKRLSKRKLDETNYSIATYDDYLWMKKNIKRVPDNLIDYTINTELDIEKQVKDFLTINLLI